MNAKDKKMIKQGMIKKVYLYKSRLPI